MQVRLDFSRFFKEHDYLEVTPEYLEDAASNRAQLFNYLFEVTQPLEAELWRLQDLSNCAENFWYEIRETYDFVQEWNRAG